MLANNTPRVLIIGASGGIGGALAAHYEQASWLVARYSRSDDGIDLSRPHEAADMIVARQSFGEVQRLWIATGLLAPEGLTPERRFDHVNADAMAAVIQVNAIGPAVLLARLLPLLPRDGGVRVGVIGARVGSIADNRLGGWYSYRASKAALHQIVRTAAIEWQRTHPRGVLAAIHPGTVDTALSRRFLVGRQPLSPAASAEAVAAVLERLDPSQSGRIFGWDGIEIAP